MANSRAELLAKTEKATQNARKILRLLCIADTAVSPTAAENMAEEEGYPFFLKKEAWELARLKRDRSVLFTEHIGAWMEAAEDAGLQRIFPCHWGAVGEELTFPGELRVAMHEKLPAMFWPYHLYDHNGRLVFTSSPAITPDYNFQGALACILGAGSKFLPVGLQLTLTSTEQEKKILFRRHLDSYTLNWERIIPRPKQVGSIELYSRWVGSHGSNDAAERITLRNLLPEEADVFHSTEVDSRFLFVSSKLRYPLDGDHSLVVQLVTAYEFPCLPLPEEAPHCIAKAEMPVPDSAQRDRRGGWLKNTSENVMVLCRVTDECSLPLTETPLHKEIVRIAHTAPCFLKGPATLNKCFGFTEKEPSIYSALVPWITEKE